jgi:cyclic pyranopterin phosphate synthase
MLLDAFGRQIDYLRISITDRCNLRCFYCTPEGGQQSCRAELLTFEELEKVAEAAALAGISKIRITGGEPLERKGVVELCRRLNNIEGLEDLSLTTNGVRLKEFARPLFQAGVSRINVSLDTLQAERFTKITGRNQLSKVLTGIVEAREIGFYPIKINTVVIREVNEDEIIDLARLSLTEPYHIRFIELMPTNGWSGIEFQSRFVSMEEIKTKVSTIGPLAKRTCSNTFGPANLFSLPEAVGRVGFIAAVSRHFCRSCNRLRLTADGKLRACLFSVEEMDIKGALRAGAARQDLVELFKLAADRKPEQHSLITETSQNGEDRTMRAIGG